MDQLEIRHLFDKFINNSENLNWHGGGIDLETGEMDLTFDHDGRIYELRLKDIGPHNSDA